ncbi:Carrier protein, mitochondrial [Coemansia sp. RSA 1722]|nr:Carrier protein, mitochondrial [Coemansia sp. RSA 486]KAJ2236809.1 Carrier protein, mitochondrial [Coemansia sp. RSA 485]KAJ2597006.1 Carrier protein, mitochondrial [Coemansia sp. RSA 1722]
MTTAASTSESALQSKILSACTGAVITSLLMTPFDVVKTRQQSRTLVRAEALVPAVREWRAARAGSRAIVDPLTISCLCDPTAGSSNHSKVSVPRTTASLCLCVDAGKGSGFFTSTQNTNRIGETWRRVYDEVVSVPRSLIENRRSRIAAPSPSSASSSLMSSQSALSSAAAAEGGAQISGTVAGMRYIARTEGVRTLWRGLSPTLVASGPSTVIYFVGYDYLRQWMGRQVRQSGWGPYEKYVSLLAGCLARTTAVTAISPLELVRTRMQSSASHNLATVMHGISRDIRSGGVGTLWRGLVPTLWRDVPFSALYWFGFERWKENVYTPLFGARHKDDMATQIAVAFCSGASSGIVAATLTTPFDVAKTRRQIEQHADTRSHLPQHPRLPQILRHIAATEGFGGLFAGLAPRLMKVAPSCAIMISTYEFGKLLLSRA